MFIGFLVLLLIGCIEANKYNVSYDALSKCKQYNAVSGYNYGSSFRLSEMENHKTDEHNIINLRLYVLASKDAHILLSTDDSGTYLAPHYEIVIGAGGNKFSEIRKTRRKNALVTKSTKDVLSAIDPLPLILKVTTPGLIELLVDGQELPMISAITENVNSIKYISFTSWGSTPAKWFYDCKDEEHETEITAKPLTTRQQLEKDLFSSADPYVPPQDLEYIDIAELKIKRIAYNSLQDMMTTQVSLRLTWVEPKCQWDPEKYDNITVLRNPPSYSFWEPTIMLDNAKGFSFIDLSIVFHFYTLFPNGTIIAQSSDIELETWCTLQPDDSHWPADENYCDIIFSVDKPYLPLYLQYPDSITIENDTVRSDWKLYSVAEYNAFDVEKYYVRDDYHGIPLSVLVVGLHLKRNHLFYKNVFFTPYFCAMVMILSSFWINGRMRVFLIALGLLILVVTFLSMVKYAPRTYVPRIVQHYQMSMVWAWFCFLLFIIDSWFEKHPPNSLPCFWIIRFINFPLLRFLVALESNNSYDYLQEKNFKWKDLSKVLDRFFFYITFLYFVVVLVIQF